MCVLLSKVKQISFEQDFLVPILYQSVGLGHSLAVGSLPGVPETLAGFHILHSQRKTILRSCVHSMEECGWCHSLQHRVCFRKSHTHSSLRDKGVFLQFQRRSNCPRGKSCGDPAWPPSQPSLHYHGCREDRIDFIPQGLLSGIY